MQTAAEGVNNQGGQTQGLPFFSRDETSQILFPGEQILLDTTAFHLDTDLFFFPARVILFHFARFNNNFLPLPTSNWIFMF